MANNNEFLSDILVSNAKKDKSFINITDENGKVIEKIEINKNISNSVFVKYQEKRKIAKEIAKSIVENGCNSGGRKTAKANQDDLVNNLIKEIETDGRLLYHSDTNKITGLLTVCPAVSALINTCYGMMSVANGDWDANHEYDYLINNVLNYVLHKIYKKDENDHRLYENYVFDASPYISDYEFTHEESYLDTITWVILVLQTVRDYAILPDPDQRLNLRRASLEEIYNNKKQVVEYDEKEHAELLNEINDGIVACVKMVSDMAICYENEDKNSEIKYLCKGWSFTNVKPEDAKSTEASLYFTYVATTVYLGLYKGFSKYIDIFRKIEKSTCKCFEPFVSKIYLNDAECVPVHDTKKYWLPDNWAAIKKAKNDYLIKYNSQLNLNDDELTEERIVLSEDDLALFDMIDSIDFDNTIDALNIDLLMNKINGEYYLNCYKFNENAYLRKLHSQCLSAADNYWNTFKENIGDNFVYPNGNKVNEEAIRNSGASNELFNGLFICGIILNSAYDIQISDPNEKDYLIDTLQACLQKTQRYYDNLERNDEAYKVNNYTLQFVEKDNANGKLGTILRKSGIKVCSLIPMLLKTNSLISEYVIQYPQRQMRTHLESIMKNRLPKAGKFTWCWEADGYQSISNYYYIDALNAFYKYYDQYEKQYIDIDNAVVNKLVNSTLYQDALKHKIEKIKTEANQKVTEANIEKEAFKKELDIANNAVIEKEREIRIIKDSNKIGEQILDAIDQYLDGKIVEKVITKLNEKICSQKIDNKVSDAFLKLVTTSLLNAIDDMEKVQICGNIFGNLDHYGGRSNIDRNASEEYKEMFVQNTAKENYRKQLEKFKQDKDRENNRHN